MEKFNKLGNELGKLVKKKEEKKLVDNLLSAANEENLIFLYETYGGKLPALLKDASEEQVSEFVKGVKETMFAKDSVRKILTIRVDEEVLIAFAEICADNNESMQKNLENYIIATTRR